MKFMKLGSRPDTFYTTEALRCISSEVSSDLIIQVKGSKYLLHKFPLLSKCLRLQRLCSEPSPPSSQPQIIQLPDFPGGAEAFELCAKFCYGITITLSAYNIVAARCAAEYLQMTEDAEKGNLVFKLEAFFGSCVLSGWRDSLLALVSTKSFPGWSEDLRLTSRCLDAVVSKVLTNPSKVNLSHSRSGRRRDDVSSSGRGWWAEDLAELEIGLYWRAMVGIKSGGKVPPALIGDALKIYAARWLPSVPRSGFDGQDTSDDDAAASKSRVVLESIVSLLPSERGSVSCGFLLKLLKAGNVLRASSSSKVELARRVAAQLEEAAVSDLLIPCSLGSKSKSKTTKHDVDLVIMILDQFMSQGRGTPPESPPRLRLGHERRRRSRSAENVDFGFEEGRRSSSASHGSKLRVAKLVDGYLQEIAGEVNLGLNKFIAVAEALPEFSRVDHDDLYRAIDIYLKAHPELSKSERKRLCRILDCKKMSVEACMHAAQNEMLPLRVVVQVLFFEQARATTLCGGIGNAKLGELPSNIRALLASNGIDPSRPTLSSTTTTTTTIAPPEDQWSTVSALKSPANTHKLSTLRMKLAEDDNDVVINSRDGIGRSSSSKLKALCALPNRPRKMLTKLWSATRTPSEKN